MKRLLLSLLLSLIVGFAWAGDVEDAAAAIDRKDYVTALKKFKSAAASGNAFAQRQIGFAYTLGLGVKADSAEAIKWHMLAAEQGDTLAQRTVGDSYYFGQGVLQDYSEAMKWYRVAALGGHLQSKFMLGLMHLNGEGVIQDYVKAHMWLNLSAVNGSVISVERRDMLAKLMTAQQVAEAQEMARECLAKKYKGCD